MIPEAAIGVIVAASIAGTVTLLGLIITKEQKTSEFRQAWIDALRSEIATYLTSFNAIADGLTVTYANQAEKVKSLGPLHSAFNSAGFSISLRVNPKEKPAKELMACMAEFGRLAKDEALMVPENIEPVIKRFSLHAKALLKSEWERVKGGETTFRVTKYVAGGFSLIGLFAILYIAFADRGPGPQQTPTDGPKDSAVTQPASLPSVNAVNSAEALINADPAVDNMQSEPK